MPLRVCVCAAGESVAEYLHKAGDSPKVTKWKRDGARWVPVDPNLALENNVRDGDDLELRKKVALCGVQSYLKMLMMDNFIHADLHPGKRLDEIDLHMHLPPCPVLTPSPSPLLFPGNVLVRMEEADWIARLQRYLLIGQSGHRVPHIVFLDAGLAASFNTTIYSNVQGFFESIIKFDGATFGRAILGLAPAQPYVKSPQVTRRRRPHIQTRSLPHTSPSLTPHLNSPSSFSLADIY